MLYGFLQERQCLRARVFGEEDDVRPSEVINEGSGLPRRVAVYEGGREIHPCCRQRHFDWNTVDWPSGPMALSADPPLSFSKILRLQEFYWPRVKKPPSAGIVWNRLEISRFQASIQGDLRRIFKFCVRTDQVMQKPCEIHLALQLSYFKCKPFIF